MSVLLTAGCATAESGGNGAEPTPSRAATPTVAATVAATRTVRAALDVTGRTAARTVAKTELGKGAVPACVISGDGAHDFAKDRGIVSVGMATAARFEEVFADGRVYIRGNAGDETMPWSYVDRDDVDARHVLRAPANDPEYTLRQAAMGEKFQQVGACRRGGRVGRLDPRLTAPAEDADKPAADRHVRGGHFLQDARKGDEDVRGQEYDERVRVARGRLRLACAAHARPRA
ncbi:hypothetical protein [Streptomyces sp. NPDC058583]|uniref:hypothetical protein n=1 Tax=unclassified Streptomyces TaxID=2593676 RepID=UPI00364AA82B